jgi:hypothetical protein
MPSIYTQLLMATLAAPRRVTAEPTTVERLREVRWCRGQLGTRQPSASAPGWAPGAIGDQLAYDVALVGLARALGVACDENAFDPPQPERRRLEAALAARGVSLGGVDEPVSMDEP